MNIGSIQRKLLDELSSDSLKQIVDNQNESRFIPIILHAVAMVLGMKSPTVKSINVLLSKRSAISKILNATQDEITGKPHLTKPRKQSIRKWMEYRPGTFGQLLGYKGKYPLVYTLRNWCMVMTNDHSCDIAPIQMIVETKSETTNTKKIETANCETQCDMVKPDNTSNLNTKKGYCCKKHRNKTTKHYYKVQELIEKVRRINADMDDNANDLSTYESQIIDIKREFQACQRQSILDKKSAIRNRIESKLQRESTKSNISAKLSTSSSSYSTSLKNNEQTETVETRVEPKQSLNVEQERESELPGTQTMAVSNLTSYDPNRDTKSPSEFKRNTGNKHAINDDKRSSYNTLEILRDIRELMSIDEDLREDEKRGNTVVLNLESKVIPATSQTTVVGVDRGSSHQNAFTMYSDGLEEQWELNRKSLLSSKNVPKLSDYRRESPITGYVMGEANDEKDIEAFEAVGQALKDSNGTKNSVALWVDFGA